MQKIFERFKISNNSPDRYSELVIAIQTRFLIKITERQLHKLEKKKSESSFYDYLSFLPQSLEVEEQIEQKLYAIEIRKAAKQDGFFVMASNLPEFKLLEVQGKRRELLLLVENAIQFQKGLWKHIAESKAQFGCVKLSSNEKLYVFQRAADDKIPAANLHMILGAGYIRVVKILPEVAGTLSRIQHNAIIDEFNALIIKPFINTDSISYLYNPERPCISQWLSKKAYRLLKSFSDSANKSNETAHPLDSQRWKAFLIQTHRDKVSLDGDSLQKWLEEEGWREESALELSRRYEMMRDLLIDYDKIAK
jgi:hypothetical protein